MNYIFLDDFIYYFAVSFDFYELYFSRFYLLFCCLILSRTEGLGENENGMFLRTGHRYASAHQQPHADSDDSAHLYICVHTMNDLCSGYLY